jgi:hypothetical protein
MGTLTRAQLETDLKFRMGNRTDIDNQLTTAIQYSYDDLVTAIRIPENQETAVLQTEEGVSTVAAPDDFYAPVSVRNMTDGHRLIPITARQHDAYRDTTIQDIPTHYLWWRNEITFFPIPNSTVRIIQLRYLKRLLPLSTSTTVSSLPREWDEVIVQGGLYRLQSWMGLKQEASASLMEYNIMISKRIDRIAEFFFDPPAPSQIVTTGRTWDN